MGCTVSKNRHGNLALRLWWKGRRSWEGTGEPETPSARAHLERIAAQINKEIAAGLFDGNRYRFYFPSGNRLVELDRRGESECPTLREFATLSWLPLQVPPKRRARYKRDADAHLRLYLLDEIVAGRPFGDYRLDQITPVLIDALRDGLLARGISMKTAKNAISATLSAILKEARRRTLISGLIPTREVEWRRQKGAKKSGRKIDPMTEDESVQVLEYFKGRWPRVYPLIATLIYAGLRPSEAVALQWGDIDLRKGTLSVERSRVRGHNDAPKTDDSERTLRIIPELVEILSAHNPIDADIGTPVFRNVIGSHYDQDKLRERYWAPALRALKIRPRPLYQCRHTSISLALSRGANPVYVATYHGTSPATIWKHYMRFIELGGDDQLAYMRPTKAVGKGRKRKSLATGRHGKMQGAEI